MMGFAVIVGEVVGLSSNGFHYTNLDLSKAAFYGFWAGFLLLAASMVLNDYFDREIDAINSPTKPLPSGAVNPSEALSLAIVLTSFGLLFAASTGPSTLLTALLSIVLMVAYNAKAKRFGLLGNGLVSVNMAIPFIYGGVAVRSLTWSLAIFATLAFLASLGREIMKGIVDVKGDAAKGIRSVAVTKGSTQAGKQSAVLFVSAVALSALPMLFGLVSILYLPLVAICDAGFLMTSYSITASPTPRNAKRDKNFVLLWMTFGLLAFVIGSL
jgi:geranylgeranylglycerol-phosphate geranylgeranyltransferase